MNNLVGGLGSSFHTVVTTTKNLDSCFITPLGSDQPLLAFYGTEEISRLYEFEVTFFSADPQIDPKRLLNKPATIEFKSKNKKLKYFSGIIKGLAQGTSYKKERKLLTEYKALLVPKLSLLKLAKSYVFFQNKTVLDIIKIVLKKHGLTNVEYRTTKLGKTKRESCIQYDETDFDFICRLMEEDGLFYFFRYGKDGETLIISDNNQVFIDDKIKFYALNDKFNTKKGKEKKEHFAHSCVLCDNLLTDKFFLDSYDYNKPNTKLSVNDKNSAKSLYGNFYDYERHYDTNAIGKVIVGNEAEAFAFNERLFQMKTQEIIHVGNKFDIVEHDAAKFNDKYIMSKIVHNFDVRQEIPYYNIITAFPSKTICRIMPSIEKPKIYGYLSAVVTGQEKSDVFRDRLARVKIRFLWDLDGVKNKENSSGWVRVAQTFAGSNFGAIFLPRVGQEVIVSFLNGDPDRPVIVGALYNGSNKPPYTEAEISCIKTQTFGDKTGFNELKFNDKKKHEEVYMRAQKDFVMLINENSTITLKKGNYTLTLEKGDVKVDVKGKVNLKTKEDITFDSDKKIVFKSAKGIVLDTDASIEQKAKKDVTIKASTGKFSVNATRDATVAAKGNIKLSSSMSTTLNSKMTTTIKSSVSMTLDAKMAMNIKSGMAMNMESKMSAKLVGKMGVTISSNLMVSVKSTLALNLDGMMLNLKAKAFNSVGGALIKIG